MRTPAALWPRGGLWRHADFLKLWSAQSISQLGTQISGIALPLVALYALHASAFQVAALGTVEFLPFLLFTLPAGVWVDRLRRRWIMVVRGESLPEDFLAGRYHSLAAITVPDCFEVSATAADGEVMAVRHRELPVDGVQFHPESVLTPVGRDIAKNFLEVV